MNLNHLSASAAAILTLVVTLVATSWQGWVTRRFQARENRYADRREAVSVLIAAAEDETDRVEEFNLASRTSTGGISFGEWEPEYFFPTLNAAHAQLVLLAEPAVREAGTRLRDAVIDCYWGEKECWPKYRAALDDLIQKARVMLDAE